VARLGDTPPLPFSNARHFKPRVTVCGHGRADQDNTLTMTILLNNNGYNNCTWQAELQRQLPDVKICRFGETFDPAEISYALVWNHPAGDLQRYPNLRAVFSLGAGTEHLIADTSIPDVPVVLLADPSVARDMAAHGLYWVLDHHRRYSAYRDQQADQHWHRANISPTSEFRVGVLGLGRIGSEVATRIRSFGYDVSGWDGQMKEKADISTSWGLDQLDQFLNTQDVVINCLPLTDATFHFLGSKAFAAMKLGAFFVNISRGAVVDDAALLASVDASHLSGAALDAFAAEPLPKSSPFWDHPKISVTPHVAGATFASSAVRIIVGNIHKLEAGNVPQPLFNRASGY
jgi:glyoxylate/hydroxypyruvate reductase A